MHGYRQKQIQIITGYTQSSVSKLVHKEFKYLPTLEHATEEQLTRKFIMDKLLECNSIPTGGFTDADIAYIKLLDFVLVDRQKIKKIYWNISQYKVSYALRQSKITKEDFEPHYLGISEDEYKLFLDEIKKF